MLKKMQKLTPFGLRSFKRPCALRISLLTLLIVLAGCENISPPPAAGPTPSFPSDEVVEQLCVDPLAYTGAVERSPGSTISDAEAEELTRERFIPLQRRDEDFGLVRYSANGTLDEEFGHGGTVAVDLGARREVASAIILQDDNKAVLVGYSDIIDTTLALVRLNTDGTLDETFGDAGTTTTTMLSDEEVESNEQPNSDLIVTVNAIELPDGKILVAAERGWYDIADSPPPSPQQIFLARYTADGQLDGTFGEEGIVITQVENNPIGQTEIHALTLQPNGHILVGGSYRNEVGPWQLLIVRYAPDGTLDETFGENGVVLYNEHYDDVARALVADAEGILAGGFWSARFGPNFPLQGEPPVRQWLRLDDDGALDPTFDTNAGGEPISRTSINSLHQLDDGTLLATGWGGWLARFRPDGTLVESFGEDGVVRTRDALSGDDMVVQNERIWVLSRGRCSNLVRYTLDGTLDTSFGDEGIVALDDGVLRYHTLAVQPDGSVLIGGNAR